MKKTSVLLTAAFALVLFAIPTNSQAQLLFGVKPGSQVQSSYFGFMAGTNMVIQFGLDYARVGVGVKMSVPATEFTPATEADTDISANMMMPHAGVKFYLAPRAPETVTPYILGDFFKAFTSFDLGELAEDGDETQDFIQDVLSPWGLNIGFGAEYHFSEKFSFGAEYGFKYIMSSAKLDEANMELSTNLGITYAAFTVNFTL